jgi:glycosyltransferase involved in cell wall biosynthesis
MNQTTQKKDVKKGGLRSRGILKENLTAKPLVSIITAVYNGQEYLEETIQSVLNQTYNNIEYIIIDGGSTDGTIDIIKKYEDRLDYWISEKDNGIYDAWNKGVQSASGEWIAFLGADDIYSQNAIEMYISKILLSNHEFEYISSKVMLCTLEKKPLRHIGSSWNWNDFSAHMNVAHVGSLHNKILFENYGLFDTNFRICGDYEFLLRPRNNLKASFLSEETCYMRVGGISNENLSMYTETYKAKIMHKTRYISLFSKIDMYIDLMKWYTKKFIKYNER